MSKSVIFWLIVLIFGLVLIGLSVWVPGGGDVAVSQSPEPATSGSLPSLSPSPLPTPTPRISTSRIPLPTADGKTTFIDEKVPWELLMSDASCELKGEIKFLTADIYDNQDAEFIYNGIDHPGRNIKWTVTPAEKNLEIGPNIFSRIPIPSSSALLGVFPKGALGYKRYELTAVIEYGRLVDQNGKFVTVGGDVRIFQKQCKGKTTVVLP